jgi:glucokinase
LFNGGMNLRAGVDLGGTKIQAVVVDDRYQVVGEERRATPTKGKPADVAAEIVAAVRGAAAAAEIEAGELSSIGVGSPGDVDDANGTVTTARNLPNWEGSFPLAAALQEALGPRVSLGNDVNVATMAEATLGAGQPYRSMLGVFWGTGVGGGVVLDGKLWLGRDAAGEIGHMVVKVGGAKCPCGRHGCMEAYAGRGAMETRARELAKKGEQTDLFAIMEKRGRERLTSGIWARALVRQDPMAVRLIERAIEALGAGVASAVNLLDVEAVIIGGGLGVRLGDPYRKRLEHAMLPHIFADHRPPRVLLAQLGDLGGAIGAALLASEAEAVGA